MIVGQLHTQAYRLPMAVPWDAAGSDLVVVVTTATTDDGTVGTGFTWTPSQAAAALVALITDELHPMVEDRPLTAPPVSWERMSEALRETGSGGLTTLAMAAVDILSWDLWARQGGRSLIDAIGRRRERVELYASGVNRHLDIDELRAQVERWVAAGSTRFKVKVGRPDLDEDVDRVAAVREIIGPDATLMIDANRRWDVPRARQAIAALARFEPAWIEEPLPADDIAAHADLRRQSSTPIAAGESLYNKFQFRDLITARAVDYVQPNVCRVGGITPTLAIADLAHAFSVPVMLHLVPDLSTQLALCLPLPSFVEDIDQAWFSDLGALHGVGGVQRHGSFALATGGLGHGLAFATDSMIPIRTTTEHT